MKDDDFELIRKSIVNDEKNGQLSYIGTIIDKMISKTGRKNLLLFADDVVSNGGNGEEDYVFSTDYYFVQMDWSDLDKVALTGEIKDIISRLDKIGEVCQNIGKLNPDSMGIKKAKSVFSPEEYGVWKKYIYSRRRKVVSAKNTLFANRRLKQRAAKYTALKAVSAPDIIVNDEKIVFIMTLIISRFAVSAILIDSVLHAY